MHYIRGITTSGEEEFICKAAATPQEATALIEQGIQYITGEYNDGGKLFRKRKKPPFCPTQNRATRSARE
jgi:hypothetical protein